MAMAEPARLAPTKRRRIPAVQVVRSLADFERVVFHDDMALIDVPVEALDALPFKNDHREDDPRLKRIIQSIREDGYNPVSPIKVRLGRKGNWVVVDGGHRMTAARKVAREFWPNLFGRKVRTLSFLIYRTPLSYSLVDDPDVGAAPPEPGDPAAADPPPADTNLR